MFKKIKQGKMLEMEASKPTACGGHINTGCTNCSDSYGDRMSEAYIKAYDEHREYWGE